MNDLVRCTHCGGTYRLGNVVVTARYTDCSCWNAPCCNTQVDDRGETGWKSLNDYVRIDENEVGMPDMDGTYPRQFRYPHGV
jgi:hypothetical protein